MISRAVIELPRASLGSDTSNSRTMKLVVSLRRLCFDDGATALVIGEEGGDHREEGQGGDRGDDTDLEPLDALGPGASTPG